MCVGETIAALRLEKKERADESAIERDMEGFDFDSKQGKGGGGGGKSRRRRR